MKIGTFVGTLALLAGVLGAPLALPAQDTVPRAPGADATRLPIEPVRTLSFSTDEGTWMSLDVSPDGRTILFDLLGDLYLLPVDGGEARRLTSGMEWDGSPRWSPDGASIAFISDRSGSDNVWIIDADGTDPRQVSTEKTFTVGSPEWTPDGEYVVVRRSGPYPGPEDYLRDIPLWIYHRSGGSGTELHPRGGRVTTNSGASFSPDGETMYFSSHPGGYTDDLGQFQVVAFDRESGSEHALTRAAGGALRPIASPDGRWLVYATRADAKTALRIRDLRTQEDRWLVAEVQRDDQEGYGLNDVFPGYSFTPDSRSVVFTADGKIKRVDVQTREVATVPFNAQVAVGMGERLFVPLRIEDGPFQVRQMATLEQSPRGTHLAFGALGQVWVSELRGTQAGAPRRLTLGELREYQPAFSPDGEWVAYVTWSDSAGGFLWKARTDGRGSPVRLTREPALVTEPMWSPDGQRIVFASAARQAGLGPSVVAPAGELRWVAASGCPSGGCEAEPIVRTSAGPALVDSERVYFLETAPGGGNLQAPTFLLASVTYSGADRRVHARLTSTNAGALTVRVAPDRRHLLVLDRDDAYLLPITAMGGEGLVVDLKSPVVPVRRLTRQGANHAAWSDGGRTITWSFTNHFYRAPTDSVMLHADTARWDPQHVEVTLMAPRAAPEGQILLRGGRVVTMRGDEVLERADVLVQGSRIARVAASIEAPAGARVIDVTGKTIIPGLVDIHAHPPTGRDIAPDQEWSLAANLAYGVTTTHNPSTPRGTFAWGELVDAGEMVGPRIFATGRPLTSTQAVINSYQDALDVVRRYKEQGATSLKQYIQPQRIQRQWILQAALAEGINVTNEGTNDLKADITMAMDGFTGLEHSIGVVPLYKDVVTVLADSRIAYTPTLVVAYGAPAGDSYWRARSELHEDAKLRRFTPHELLDRQVRRRPLIVEEDYNFPLIARGVRDVVRAGGLAGLGSHGQQEGIAAHWELWMLQSGDMTPHEALRISTALGAEALGYARDLGSIEAGKLADLVVLNSNPLDDIRNSVDVELVMKNGELFEGATLNRIWPSPRALPTPYWVTEREELDAIRSRQR